ncbi:MAG: hypothetical protein J5750_01520 [Clostridiales bacterium]|nr:hypothetical protein [Clostridiales bacterium]
MLSILRQHKTSSLFIAFLLLAGICSLISRDTNAFLSSLMFCINNMIFVGLILFWMQTIRTRLLPTRMRAYIITAAVLMIGYILLRAFKYRAVIESPWANRYCNYGYFIPLLIIPTMLLVTAMSMVFGGEHGRKRERLIIFLAFMISMLAMTNDLHHLVYVPKDPTQPFTVADGTYRWGPCFYFLYAWLILMLVSALVILFFLAGKRKKNVFISLLVIIALWLALDVGLTYIFARYDIARMYNTPEINCFMMLMIFECCIRSRMIPYNQDHIRMFPNLRMPVLITDSDLRVFYKTASPIEASPEQLSQATESPCYLDEETRLCCTKIRAGYAFWTENEHELLEKRRSLAAANELLNEENDLIAVENKLKEQKARLDAQDQVYARIAAAIRPKQKKIDEILENVAPEDSAFAEELGKTCVYNAYSKRKTNLLLLSEEHLPRSNRELFLALSESCRFLNCCGIDAAAVGEEYSDFPLSVLHDLYDTFETVIETYMPILIRMTVSINKRGIRIAAEAKGEAALPETILPVEMKESDGVLFFTIRSGNVARPATAKALDHGSSAPSQKKDEKGGEAHA